MNSAPPIVLFSGGSASNALACALEQTGAEVIHVISVFDNGGSAGELRRFSPQPFPAVGDIRKRLLALAPAGTDSQAAVKQLFASRLSLASSGTSPRRIAPDHPLLSSLPISAIDEILGVLNSAIAPLPAGPSFDELSVGNLLIFGRTLQTGNSLEAINWARRLLNVSSQVLPVTLASVHLGAECEGGEWISGQATLTDPSVVFPGRIKRLCLLQQEETHEFRAQAKMCSAVAEAMASADALVLGFGSFLTSILPHFLVRGVGAAFSSTNVPRFFLINPTSDKETQQFTVASMLEMINQYARADSSSKDNQTITDVLHFGPEPEKRIPTGNISAFPVRYQDLSQIELPEQMAARAAEIIVASAGLQANLQPSSLPRPVILFDLDATLFDYPRLRIEATATALEGMVTDPAGISRDLFELLRQPLADVFVGLGFPNLRRNWDAPDVFVLASLLENPSSRKTLLALTELAEANGSSEEDVSLARRILSYQRAAYFCGREDVQVLFDKIVEARQHLSLTLEERTGRFRRYVNANARLNPGAADLIHDSLTAGAEVHVVSEGDFAVQRFKFDSLKLADLVQTCIVTDVTCGILPLLDELFVLHKDLPADRIPHAVLELYDQLAPLTIKSEAFYTKLLHALRQSASDNLESRMKSFRFLTPEEWEAGVSFRLVMVGDRYRKDLEPLLRICSCGLQSFRVLSGRYSREDPLHEIVAQRRPAPTAYVSDLLSLRSRLSDVLRDPCELVRRPAPTFPAVTTIQAVQQTCPGLSDNAKRILHEIERESLRHHSG
jgi:2-phospho-L-lactate transferase/gluconeogenesis factor (CofD/UPF0052 family)/phosphoglycolate phosphatase-like HAD superfamily hydrolase